MRKSTRAIDQLESGRSTFCMSRSPDPVSLHSVRNSFGDASLAATPGLKFVAPERLQAAAGA